MGSKFDSTVVSSAVAGMVLVGRLLLSHCCRQQEYTFSTLCDLCFLAADVW